MRGLRPLSKKPYVILSCSDVRGRRAARTAVARESLYTDVSGCVPKGMSAHGCVANPHRARPHAHVMALALGGLHEVCVAEAVAAARFALI